MMVNQPLVSIALATYNGEKYIEQQLQSLLAQDYPNLEIIISDDCSNDGTWDILQFYASIDSRIKLLPRTQNVGYVNNFIRVFKECRGELISPCDQDDIWYSNKTSRLVEEIGDSTLIYCNNRYIDEKNISLGVTHSDKVNMIFGSDVRQLLFCTSICGHTMLFKKELLNFNNQLVEFPYIDWVISFLAAEHGYIKYLNEVLVDWRQHNTSTTFHIRNKQKGSKAKNIESDVRMLELFSKLESTQKKFIEDAKKSLISWFNSYIGFSMLIFIFRYGSVTHYSHPAKFPFIKYMLGYKLKKILYPKYY